jgi:hypothetical protein
VPIYFLTFGMRNFLRKEYSFYENQEILEGNIKSKKLFWNEKGDSYTLSWKEKFGVNHWKSEVKSGKKEKREMTQLSLDTIEKKEFLISGRLKSKNLHKRWRKKEVLMQIKSWKSQIWNTYIFK